MSSVMKWIKFSSLKKPIVFHRELQDIFTYQSTDHRSSTHRKLAKKIIKRFLHINEIYIQKDVTFLQMFR